MRVKGLPNFTAEDKLEAPSLRAIEVVSSFYRRVIIGVVSTPVVWHILEIIIIPPTL